MAGTYIGKIYTEYQNEFVEHFPYGKQFGKILDIENKQKCHRAPKHILLGLRSEKSGNQVPNFEFFEKKHLKVAHESSVHNGSYAFPNELVRFRI